MSLPKDGGDVGGPAALAPGGGGSARPREGSRDIQREGKIVSVPDDWCHSPIKIVPYPIWAWQSDASNLADTVRQTDDRSHAKHSIVQMCFGDEAGIGGGVISHTHNGACWPKTWSETVRFQGRNAVRHDDEWWMNDKNTWGKLQYTKDMDSYGLPKVNLIKSRMAGLSSTDAFIASSSGNGAKVASAAGAISLPTAAGGGGIGEALGQIGQGIVQGGKWVAGVAEEASVGAAAGTTALAGGLLVLSTTSTAADDVRVTGSGDCTAAQQRALQDKVNENCKGQITRCLPGDTKEVIAAKIARATACIASRTRINNTCYRGGDDGHKQQIVQAYRTIAACWALRRAMK